MLIAEDHASIDGNTRPDFGAFQRACRAVGSTSSISIMRAAWGMVPDPTIGRDWVRARDSGQTCGAYLFLRTHQEFPPEDQVHVFADNVGSLRQNDLPPVIDIEDTGMPPEMELEWVHRAWTEMKIIYGVAPIFYTSARVWLEDLHNLPAGEMIDSPLWLAKPWPWAVHSPARLDGGPFDAGNLDPVVPVPWGPQNWWLHQYQGDAFPAPGFSNTVDLSRFKVMREGETGERVKWVQRRLGMAQTGTFDADMTRRIKAFQALHGLTVDGVIGPKTWPSICWSTGAERSAA